MSKPNVALPTPEQTSEIASLYRSCFPTSFRSRVGQEYCHAFFSQLTTHSAYRVLVATLDSRLLGFAVLHTDRLSSLPSRWQRAFWPQLALFAVKHPWFIAGRASNVVSRRARRPVHLGTRVDAREEFRESVYLDDIAVSGAARGSGACCSRRVSTRHVASGLRPSSSRSTKRTKRQSSSIGRWDLRKRPAMRNTRPGSTLPTSGNRHYRRQSDLFLVRARFVID